MNLQETQNLNPQKTQCLGIESHECHSLLRYLERILQMTPNHLVKNTPIAQTKRGTVYTKWSLFRFYDLERLAKHKLIDIYKTFCVCSIAPCRCPTLLDSRMHVVLYCN